MAIQVRRGNEADFDPNKLLPGETATTLDTKKIFHAFAPGDIHQMAIIEEMTSAVNNAVNNATEDIQTEFTANVTAATNSANTAAQSANSAATNANNKAQTADTATIRANTAAQNAESIVLGDIATTAKVGVVRGDGEVRVDPATGDMTIYSDKSTNQSGTSIHTETADDGLFEITKIEGATTVTPADPTKDISPDNVAVITNGGNCKAIGCGKNLANTILNTFSINGLTFTLNSDKSITINGTSTITGSYRITQKVHNDALTANLINLPYDTYTLSATNALPTGCGLTIMRYDGFLSLASITEGSKAITFTKSIINSFVYILIPQGIILNNYVLKCVLEVGSNATFYEPYKSNEITIPYDLGALPDGTKNTIEKGEDGVTNYNQASKEIILDGSTDEEWFDGMAANGYGRFSVIISNANASNNTFMCDSFKSYNQEDPNLYYNNPSDNYMFGCEKLSSNTEKFFITCNKATDLATFKTWLSAHPIKVRYKLATPITTPINDIMLQSYQGITNILTDSNPQITVTGNFKSRLWKDGYLAGKHEGDKLLHKQSSGCTQTGENANAFGLGLIANGAEQMAGGRYNEPNVYDLFQVGNGSSDSVRSNAFRVDTDGNSHVLKDIFTSIGSINQLIMATPLIQINNPDNPLAEMGITLTTNGTKYSYQFYSFYGTIAAWYTGYEFIATDGARYGYQEVKTYSTTSPIKLCRVLGCGTWGELQTIK
jgi:hypothetical protein